ncbi:23S ribosomal RNA methyltransferase Erm [Sporolactobacillus sp. CPB3-1]|uniref:rRNA adenine N-6-methyltransferase n=1 Tax=Sporolactobacillus mangiferae TaxID=2940498 RepID=A0ABT0M8W8_9BACL|nr:23S ribosomal RNA methyltransferase Erm [Sporolactobacillus mangiferae]MCL1630790.1 23S ribosomal RNA methyltransferase Erm [Sporolactobacillus mangiferae]
MRKTRHRYSNKKLSRGEPPNFTGQHLMHNKRTVQDIVNKASIRKSDTVIEFGAGKGALTSELAHRSNHVLAVEIDEKFVAVLNKKLASYENVKIIKQDILSVHLPRKEFIVVSNIPYAITTPIMKMLLNHPKRKLVRGIIVMEKGAARRFVSRRIKDAYVLQWRMYFDLRIERTIPKTHFSPPPKVESAMLSIRRRDKPIIPIQYAEQFRTLAKALLRKPDESAGTVLACLFTAKQLKHLRRRLSIKDECKVGCLSEEQWGIIFNTVIKYAPHHLKRKA